ncbi:DUF3987 domain-containing protein [Urbifossiella limnaea]|uniref:DNA primase/polymerase bifunctional N-terminal domain-containing protein n=1 Tax=Urbifossiella limnaea TaxID=2528023 RepID=A0A517XT81_9BACT|nr:DUF3987 domain-containing protein [Urbifossiella limnaea]QDU20736.1 hypothetical protein ETAA1_26950 [Urbifossiella limnaea]
MTTPNVRLAAALDYAARGWPVLALHNPVDGGCSCRKSDCAQAGKHPRTAHGVKDASTDAATIRGWWVKWPDANVGVATGAAAGILMVGPDGDAGLADLARLNDEHGPVPPTRRGRSGSGGAHLIFNWPADGVPLTNRKNHRGLKIDVRGEGGYFVAPPSVNATGAYAWTDTRDPADAPAWLLAWVRGTSLKLTATAGPGAEERARAYLKKCDGAVSGQDGHGRTFAVARALAWGFALPDDVVLRLLRDDYNPRCTPPWSEPELAHKVKDAATKDYGKPRGYLLDAADDGGGRATNSTRSAVTPPPGWAPPVPLPTLPPVPPFPLAVFPPKVADYWQAAAAALAVPPEYVAAPGLAVVGAAAGRSRAAQIKSSWSEVPLFWTAVLAPPGSTKSAALKMARAPLLKAERVWQRTYRGELSVFDTEMDRHKSRLKEWREQGCEGEPPSPPRRPTLRQAVLDDATTEAVARVLADNERGVVVLKDELSGFVRGMDQYRGGRGADRQFWLSAWAGAPAKVNRVKDHAAGPLVIPHPFAAVAGMMCPDSLAELRGENRHGDAAADGFLDRFLFAYPDPCPAMKESWRTVTPDQEAGYADVVFDLLGLELVPDGPAADPEYRPHFVRLSHDGQLAWEEFTEMNSARTNALDEADPFRGVLAKLRGYCARFAALLWSVRRVCGLVEENAPIGVDELAGGAVLVDYFERHAGRAYGRKWLDRPGRVARRLLAWLARNPERTAFTRTDAYQQVKDERDVSSAAGLATVFALLVDHGYIRPVDRPENARPGPIPETYEVNPSWNRRTWE